MQGNLPANHISGILEKDITVSRFEPARIKWKAKDPPKVRVVHVKLNMCDQLPTKKTRSAFSSNLVSDVQRAG